jgi:hypothetical protein
MDPKRRGGMLDPLCSALPLQGLWWCENAT